MTNQIDDEQSSHNFKKSYNKIIAELKDFWHKNVHERTHADRSRHPTIYPLIAFGFFIVVIIGALASFYTLQTDVQLRTLLKKQPALLSSALDNGGCKKFDIDQWEEGFGKLMLDEGVWSVASSAPNGLLRHKNPIPLYSEIKTTFIPHSEEEVNFVINMHDIYEVVIGDGSYQGVTLKASPGDGLLPRLIENTAGEKRNIFENGSLNEGTATTIVLNQRLSQLDSDSYEVNLRILYRSGKNNEQERLFATYDFPLPPSFQYKEATSRLSLGLLAAKDGSKVAAEVLCFELNS